MDTTEEAAKELEATRIFWLVVESGIKTVVPTYIKNILRLSGYFSASTIKKFNREKIPSLEKFVKNDMELFINSTEPNYNKKDFYHVFFNDIKKFYIVDGHRDLIDTIVEFVKTESDTKGLQFFTTDPGSCSSRDSSEAFPPRKGSSKNQKPDQHKVDSSKNKNATKVIDINKVTDDLFKRIKSFLKTELKKPGQKEDNKVSKFRARFVFF